MNEILKFAKISCHHGSQKLENNLHLSIDVLKKHKEIDIIEIDFVFHDNQYISAHDLDHLEHGSSLELWIDEIMARDKILWIDLKDTQLSFFINSYTSINVERLFEILTKLHLKYKFLHRHILIGCQFIHVYEKLIQQDIFTIIQDLPRDKMYVLDAITPNQYITSLSDVVKTSIIEDHHHDIIAIDKKFFTADYLLSLLTQIDAKIIILYNFQLDDEIPYVENKKIIYQYDY
jgi:hypothetical protein